MDFFKELFLASEGLDLTMKIKRVNDKLTISVLPENTSSIQPVVLTGTWEDLDAEFFTHLKPALDTARVIVRNLDNFNNALKDIGDKKKNEVIAKKGKTPPAGKSKSSKKEEEEEEDNDEDATDESKASSKKEPSPKHEKKPEPPKSGGLVQMKFE